MRSILSLEAVSGVRVNLDKRELVSFGELLVMRSC